MLLVKQNEQTRVTNMEAKVLICWNEGEDQVRAQRILNLQPTEYKQLNTEIFLSHTKLLMKHKINTKCIHICRRIHVPGPSYDIASIL